MPDARPIVVNALCVGSGGNATLAQALPSEFASLGRPSILLLTEGRSLHQEIAGYFGNNHHVRIVWAPSDTAKRLPRTLWEKRELPELLRRENALALLQLNGMVVPGLEWPTLAHLGDPWPYLPIAYTSWKDHILAFGRRRGHRMAIRLPFVNASFTSHFLRSLIVKAHGQSAATMPVFYNGVPDHLVDDVEVVPLDEREPMLLTVSNLSPYKRQAMIIKALPLLPETLDGKPLKYHIVGFCDPVYQKELDELIASLGLQDRVVMEGRVSAERLTEVYRTARVMPFLSVCESFGIPIIEAQSYGLPTVISNQAALPEVAGDGAVVTDADTPEAAAEAIQKALEPDPLLIERGRENVKRFRWHDTAAGMVEEMDRLASQFTPS